MQHAFLTSQLLCILFLCFSTAFRCALSPKTSFMLIYVIVPLKFDVTFRYHLRFTHKTVTVRQTNAISGSHYVFCLSVCTWGNSVFVRPLMCLIVLFILSYLVFVNVWERPPAPIGNQWLLFQLHTDLFSNQSKAARWGPWPLLIWQVIWYPENWFV